MEEFKFIQPSCLLMPYVKHYWLLKTVGEHAAWIRTVPTGMICLIFHRGNRLLSVREREFHPRVFLNGHDKTFDDLRYDGQVNMISVVFRPVGIRAFFNLPMNKLFGLRLTASDMEDKELLVLENSLVNIENDKQCITLIEQFLLKRLTRLSEYNLKRIETTISLINAGNDDVVSLANAACLSRKQFERVFSEQVGVNPKTFSRTVRFQRALRVLELKPHISLTALAHECGYFDQSHMIKEFKTFSGYTPTEYIAECPPHSDYFY